jgi:hypothetical protein
MKQILATLCLSIMLCTSVHAAGPVRLPYGFASSMLIKEYTLSTKLRQVIDMPINHMILCVRVQDGAVKLFVMADMDSPVMPHNFRVFRTDRPIQSVDNSALTYIDTVQVNHRVFVHVFGKK